MIIEEMIDEEEWVLTQIIAHPVLFREFINLDDPNWNPLEEHERAWSTSTASHIAMCCGRGVHKTTSLIETLYWWMINDMFIPGDQGLFVLVPNKAQKDLTFYRIRSACETHWLISKWVRSDSINIAEGRIDFINGFQFLMRLAGVEGKEQNVIGLHTYRIWVDEAQDLPWRSWLSLQNCFKEEIPGHQFYVSGVPNGMRQGNVLYECDQLDDRYSCYNISQAMMSFWTPEMEYARRKFYHALQEDSEDYKHYVLGQHGVPTFAVFDRSRFEFVDYPAEKIVITQQMLESSRRFDATGKMRYHVEEVVLCPPVPGDVGQRPLIGVGWDVGFSPDPTVFFIMYQDSKTNAWRNLIRIVLQRVEYPLQREIFAWLDRVYQFNFLGVDMGGPGKPIYQELTGIDNPYAEHQFKERIFPVEFGGLTLVTIDDDGNEKKDQTKRVAVEMLIRWVYEHRFQFSKEDDNLVEELERTKFLRTATGEPVYRTEEDHQMAAMMCAIMAYEHKYGPPIVLEPIPLRVKLMKPHWNKPPVVNSWSV